MTSKSTFPFNFTKIDDLSRANHSHLTERDDCFFLGEYTAYEGYKFSETNDLIFNFKKSVEHKGTKQWKYKIEAIEFIATAFHGALNQELLNRLTFIPIPPSKDKTHELYDDRLMQMLHKISPDRDLDIRELIIQKKTIPAFHESDHRLTPQEIEQCYELDKLLSEPDPDVICIVDDVLTTGAHFKAAKNILSRHFTNSDIIGLFIARRVPGSPDLSNFDL